MSSGRRTCKKKEVDGTPQSSVLEHRAGPAARFNTWGVEECENLEECENFNKQLSDEANTQPNKLTAGWIWLPVGFNAQPKSPEEPRTQTQNVSHSEKDCM